MPWLVKSTVDGPVTSREFPGSRPVTVDCQVIVSPGESAVSVTSKTSVSKFVPAMICEGATLNEPDTTSTPMS